MKGSLKAATVAAAVLSVGVHATAEDTQCASRVTRDNLVACALRTSLVVEAERHELRAAEGRTLAVSPLLPANPVVSVSAGRRSVAGRAGVYNWNASLSQELAIAGQRGLRRDSARAEVEAQTQRVIVSRRDVAAAAWVAFFEALAAREQQRLASGLLAASKAVSVVARAKADQGLIAAVDADVAEAASVRVLHAKLAADREVATALATLATLLGRDPLASDLEVAGELVPLAGLERVTADAAHPAAVDRPELRTLEAERKAMELRASAFRRSRVPNPTISAFAQNDGFNERVFGLGLSLPIPIPGNVGRTYDGEIAEAEALGRRAAAEREQARREIRASVAIAAFAFETRRLEVEAFSTELRANAEASLNALGQEVATGRLTVRDAVIAQQALIELLQSYVAARRAWCLASVDLARAAGMPLEGGTP